jgi:hypothetical protein
VKFLHFKARIHGSKQEVKKPEVSTLSFCGISFGINRLMSRSYLINPSERSVQVTDQLDRSRASGLKSIQIGSNKVPLISKTKERKRALSRYPDKVREVTIIQTIGCA